MFFLLFFFLNSEKHYFTLFQQYKSYNAVYCSRNKLLYFVWLTILHYEYNFLRYLGSFYRAMHFSAKHGIAIACRLSVCLSVTLVDCDHIGRNSSKIISPLVSLGCSLFATPTWRVCSKGNTSKFGPKMTHPLLIWALETFDRKLRPNGYR